MSDVAWRRAALPGSRPAWPAWVAFGVTTVATIGGQAVAVAVGGAIDPFILGMLSFPLVGALVASRRPDNSLGWIMLAIGGVAALDGLLGVYAFVGLHVAPGSLPLPATVLALREGLWVPLIGLPGTFLLLLFPDGRLPARGWRWWGRFCGVALVGLYLVLSLAPGPFVDSGYPQVDNPLGLEAMRPALEHLYRIVLVVPVAITGCALALVVRFRRSRGLVRTQIKWLAAAAAIVSVVYGFLMVGSAANPGFWRDGAGNYGILVFFLIPAAIGVAILRYRLYDIDRIISRTVAYGLLTGSMLVVYGVLIFALGEVLPLEGDLAVAASTLAAAALFNPLRRRIQAVVDRRFNRARYDAGKTVEAFTRELRSQLKAEELAAALSRSASVAIKPASVSTWLPSRPGPRIGGSASPAPLSGLRASDTATSGLPALHG